MDRTHFNRKLGGFVLFAAWACLAAVAIVTLSQLGLIYRLYCLLAPFLNYPSMRTYATVEHLAAYTLIGILFSAAYPRSSLRLCVLLLLIIAVLETLQTFIPDRHGSLRDAAEKMLGGAVGVFLVTALRSMVCTRFRRRPIKVPTEHEIGHGEASEVHSRLQDRAGSIGQGRL